MTKAPVAVLFDEGAGSGVFGLVAEEPSAVQVDVRKVQRHRPTLGNLLGFRQIAASSLLSSKPNDGTILEDTFGPRRSEEPWPPNRLTQTNGPPSVALLPIRASSR